MKERTLGKILDAVVSFAKDEIDDKKLIIAIDNNLDHYKINIILAFVEKYNKWLVDNQYCDTDLLNEFDFKEFKNKFLLI